MFEAEANAQTGVLACGELAADIVDAQEFASEEAIKEFAADSAGSFGGSSRTGRASCAPCAGFGREGVEIEGGRGIATGRAQHAHGANAITIGRVYLEFKIEIGGGWRSGRLARTVIGGQLPRLPVNGEGSATRLCQR